MTKPILTVIIPTFNEDKNIAEAIDSVKKNIKTPHTIVVWDTGSTDQTVVLAKHAGATVINHPPIKVVEEIRQKSIDQAQTSWIFLLDADEQVTPTLGQKIDNLIKNNQADVVAIPRLNYLFGQAFKHAGWWPDYQTRLFKKGSLTWPNKVHTQPILKKQSRKIKLDLNSYLIHHNYESISDFIQRLNRYTDIQASQLIKSKKITTIDLVNQPFQEFLTRYFYLGGYKGRVLGFTVSILMAFYIFTTYTKAYQLQKHSWQNPSPLENPKTTKKLLYDYLYWRSQTFSKPSLSRFLTKLKLILLR